MTRNTSCRTNQRTSRLKMSCKSWKECVKQEKASVPITKIEEEEEDKSTFPLRRQLLLRCCWASIRQNQVRLRYVTFGQATNNALKTYRVCELSADFNICRHCCRTMHTAQSHKIFYPLKFLYSSHRKSFQMKLRARV